MSGEASVAYTLVGEWPLKFQVGEILTRRCGREDRDWSAHRGIDSSRNRQDAHSRVVCCCRCSGSPVCRLQG